MPKGQKTCRCGHYCGPRTKICPKCGQEFAKKPEKEIRTAKPGTNLGRGHKQCPKCSAVTGPRTKRCKKCGHEFLFRHKIFKSANGHKINWRDLQRGDIIKVLKGSGPYQIINNEKHPIGYYGKFRVHSIEDDGIHAYAIKKYSGHSFIFMGKKRISKYGSILRPHKVRKLKRNVDRTNT